MRSESAVESLLVAIKHATEGHVSRISPKRFEGEYTQIVVVAKAADFTTEFDTELIQLLLDLLYSVPLNSVSPCAGLGMEDLPTFCTRVYQLEEHLSGFAFIQHWVYSVFNESEKNQHQKLQLRFRPGSREGAT